MTKIKEINEKENNCNCNNEKECKYWPNLVKYLLIALIIAIFMMCCFMTHYLWKLSDIWQAIKNLPNN